MKKVLSVLVTIVVFCLIGFSGLIVLGLIVGNRDAGGLADELPDCNSDQAMDLLKRAIEEGPGEKTLGIKVFGIKDAAALDDSTLLKRHCTAVTFTNAGKVGETYTIEWLDRAKGNIWLQTQADNSE